VENELKVGDRVRFGKDSVLHGVTGTVLANRGPWNIDVQMDDHDAGVQQNVHPALLVRLDAEAEPVVAEPAPEKPVCQLSGEDGNVFNIIGRVSKALKQAGLREQANEFISRAFSSDSYDAVLRLATEYVEVE
jgi:hypothetical protein